MHKCVFSLLCFLRNLVIKQNTIFLKNKNKKPEEDSYRMCFLFLLLLRFLQCLTSVSMWLVVVSVLQYCCQLLSSFFCFFFLLFVFFSFCTSFPLMIFCTQTVINKISSKQSTQNNKNILLEKKSSLFHDPTTSNKFYGLLVYQKKNVISVLLNGFGCRHCTIYTTPHQKHKNLCHKLCSAPLCKTHNSKLDQAKQHKSSV